MKKEISITLKLQLMLMQVFFSGCKTTSDMPLLLIHIQNLSHFTCQSRIELAETVSTVLMFGCH